jgi:hypothetical protein
MIVTEELTPLSSYQLLLVDRIGEVIHLLSMKLVKKVGAYLCP